MNIKCFCFITILFLKVCAGEKNDCKPNLARSFSEFKNKIIQFFQLPDEVKKMKNKVKHRKRKIKSAFSKFVAEGVFDIDVSQTPGEIGGGVAPSLPGSQSGISGWPGRRSPSKPVREPEKHTLSASQLIIFHGYQSETHIVQTHDGYILQIHRVLPSVTEAVDGNKKIAILHHGLLGSSDDWLLLGPKKALPYLMCDAGHDVWLTNARGNIYSRQHTKYDTNTNMFWEFSFHEMGVYDLPAVIDYIIKTVRGNISEINFVGHSMGGTALLVLLSTQPKYNKVMKSATLLAPLAFMYQIKGPLKLIAEFYEQNGRNSLNFLGENEFIPIANFPHQVIDKYCKDDGRLCWNPFLLLANGGNASSDTVLVQRILSHTPAGTSTKNIRHYLQLVRSGQFQMYDNGEPGNLKAYGANQPVSYNLSYVTLPIMLFSSDDDWLCTIPNMQALLAELPNVIIHHVVRKNEFGHTDFVWGEDAPELIFHLIIDILSRDQLL